MFRFAAIHDMMGSNSCIAWGFGSQLGGYAGGGKVGIKRACIGLTHGGCPIMVMRCIVRVWRGEHLACLHTGDTRSAGMARISSLEVERLTRRKHSQKFKAQQSSSLFTNLKM